MNTQEIELLDKLYDTYSKQLYMIAKHRLNEEEKAKDAVQIVFCIAALKIKALNQHENKKLWLYQTMQNVIKQLAYDKKYTKENAPREILMPQVEESGFLEQYEFENLGMITELQGVLREREYRYIIERFVNEKSNTELSEIFELSYSGITSFGDRVLKKVKKYLEKTGKNTR